MDIHENPTVGDLYHPAVQYALDDKEKASEWFEALVEYRMSRGDYTREAAEFQEKQNIGYFAGYYDEAARRAVAEVYGAMHPIFGDDFRPTVDKAFEAGKRMALGEFPFK